MQGRSVGKGHEPELRSPLGQRRDCSLGTWVRQKFRGNGPGVRQKGVEDPATELELAQAAGQKQV